MAVTVVFPVPLAVVVVNHPTLEATVQLMLEVSVMAKLPSAAVRVEVVGLTVNVGAAWVTVTVRLIPPPEKVSVPVRAEPVLAV